MAKTGYIDNKALLQHFVDWRKLRETQPDAPLPEPIGEAALKIAQNLSKKGNFKGYTFIEDMASSSLVSVVKYAHNFDPEKSTNPFAYLTQCISASFIRFIMTEKRQSATKAAAYLNQETKLFETQPGDRRKYTNTYATFRLDALDQEAQENVLVQYRAWDEKKREYNRAKLAKRKALEPPKPLRTPVRMRVYDPVAELKRRKTLIGLAA